MANQWIGVDVMGAMQQSLLATAKAAASAFDDVEFIDAGPWANSTAAIAVVPPGSYINGDLLVLVLTGTNQTIGAPSTGGTWTQVTNSPQGTGTAGASQSVNIAVYRKIASGTQANASVTDSGVLTTGQMFSFRKVDQTTPIEVTAGSVLATAGTTHTLPAVTTTTNNAMIAHCAGIGRDALATTNYSAATNANLANLTIITSQTTSTANGGGIGLVVGKKATAGATGTTSVTVAAAAKGAFITLGIKPSTSYDSSVRVTGPAVTSVAAIQDYQYGGSAAFAQISLNSDGTVTTSGSSVTSRSTWLSNSTSGASYWVRATTISNSGLGSSFGTTGTWLQLNTNLSWSVNAQTDGVTNYDESWSLKFEFATDSGGTTIVATNVVTLYAFSTPDPVP